MAPKGQFTLNGAADAPQAANIQQATAASPIGLEAYFADGGPRLVWARQGDSLFQIAQREGVGVYDIIKANPHIFQNHPQVMDYVFPSDVMILTAPLPPVPAPIIDTIRPGEDIFAFAERQLKGAGLSTPNDEEIQAAANSIAHLNGLSTFQLQLSPGQELKLSGSEVEAAAFAAQLGTRLSYAFDKLGDGLGAEVKAQLMNMLPGIIAGAVVLGGLLFLGPPGWVAALATLGTAVALSATSWDAGKFLAFLLAVGQAKDTRTVDIIVSEYKRQGAAQDVVEAGLAIGTVGLAQGARALRLGRSTPPATKAMDETAGVGERSGQEILRAGIEDNIGTVVRTADDLVGTGRGVEALPHRGVANGLRRAGIDAVPDHQALRFLQGTAGEPIAQGSAAMSQPAAQAMRLINRPEGLATGERIQRVGDYLYLPFDDVRHVFMSPRVQNLLNSGMISADDLALGYMQATDNLSSAGASDVLNSIVRQEYGISMQGITNTAAEIPGAAGQVQIQIKNIVATAQGQMVRDNHRMLDEFRYVIIE